MTTAPTTTPAGTAHPHNRIRIGYARVSTRSQDRRNNRLYLGRSRRLATPAQIAALTLRDGAAASSPDAPTSGTCTPATFDRGGGAGAPTSTISS